jgi:DNA-binding CsgD family transcriptional regulator
MTENVTTSSVRVGLNAVKRINEGVSDGEEASTYFQSSHLKWLIEWLSKLGHGAPDSRMLQTLILRSPTYLGLRAISIMIIDENDNARNFASHGYPADAIKLQNMYTTIEEKLPSVDAMLAGKAVFLKSREQLESYSSYLRAWVSYIPWMNSLMAFPLVDNERLRGSVVWAFDSDNAQDDFGVQLFTSLTLIIQSMMAGEFEDLRAGNSSHHFKFTQKSDSSELQEKYHMSARQIQIAEMIADGATNREIAKALNFSESTARYETIKIYERLQVKNRAQAASMIRRYITSD